MSIAGHVGIVSGVDDGDCANGTNPPIAGVTIQLLDSTRHRDRHDHDRRQTAITGSTTCRPTRTRCTKSSRRATSKATITSARYGGTLTDIDTISAVTLLSGQNGINYNFCEIPPAELCGFVYVDLNNNGIKEAGEAGIPTSRSICSTPTATRPAPRRSPTRTANTASPT